MIRSMTGFGRGEARNQTWAIKVEIRSVNHRYLDISARIPKSYSQIEETIRQLVQDELSRGRVEIAVNIEEFGSKQRIVKIDEPLLQGYLKVLQTLRDQLHIEQPITVDHLLQLRDLFEVEDAEVDWDDLQSVLREALGIALKELQTMRHAEGARLFEDLSTKLNRVSTFVDQIEQIAPEVVDIYRARLGDRLAELIDGTTLTEDRFIGEVAIFAEKCSIDEELVRLKSHIEQFNRSIQSTAPIGRRLDFLLQEMNREINTIGSKGNNVKIAGLVVDVKSELEKIREQVQNIE